MKTLFENSFLNIFESISKMVNIESRFCILVYMGGWVKDRFRSLICSMSSRANTIPSMDINDAWAYGRRS